MAKWLLCSFLLCVFCSSPLWADNVTKPKIPQPFPLKKTSEKKIKNAWALWENILREESSLARTNVDTSEAAKDLANYRPELKLKQAVGLEADATRQRIKALQFWAQKNEKSDKVGHAVVAKMLQNSIKSFLRQRRKLLKRKEVYIGLQKGVSKGQMAASWFRYAFLFAKERGRYAPLLTRRFLDKLLFKPSKAPHPARNAYNLLYNLNKVYYHCDLKYSKNDKKAFQSTAMQYGPKIRECKDGRRLFGPPRGRRGMKLYWKFQEGAWRLDEVM